MCSLNKKYCNSSKLLVVAENVADGYYRPTNATVDVSESDGASSEVSVASVWVKIGRCGDDG